MFFEDILDLHFSSLNPVELQLTQKNLLEVLKTIYLALCFQRPAKTIAVVDLRPILEVVKANNWLGF